MMLSVGGWQPLMAGHYASTLQSLISLNCLDHHCTARSLAVPGQMHGWVLRVVSTALRPILNLNKKNHSDLL